MVAFRLLANFLSLKLLAGLFVLMCAGTASSEVVLAHPTVSIKYTVRPVFTAGGALESLDLIGRVSSARDREKVELAAPTLSLGDNRTLFHPASSTKSMLLEGQLAQEFLYRVDANSLVSRTATGALGPVFLSREVLYVTAGLLALPDSDSPFLLTVEFDGLPSGWVQAHGSAGLSTPMRTTRREVIGTQFAAGRFRVVSRQRDNLSLDIYLTGDWEFTDDSLADLAAALLASHIEVWGDDRAHRHVLIVHQSDGTLGAGATGRAFRGSTFIEAHKSVNLERLSHFVAHEFGHQWNARAFGLVDEPGARLFWFIEGFTDYYAWRLRVQLGVVPLGVWADEINASLLLLSRLKPVESSNAYVAEKFFSDPRLSKVPYARGAILALKWNAQIVRGSSGRLNLDSVMKNLLRLHGASGRPLGRSVIIEALVAAGIDSAEFDITRYVINGEPIVLTEHDLAPCFRVQNALFKSFELGFDAEESRRLGKVVGVRPGTNAYEAGVRDGQQLQALTFSVSDPNGVAELSLTTSGPPAIVRFSPFETTSSQVVRVVADASRHCSSSFF